MAEKNNERELTGQDKDREITQKLDTEKIILLGEDQFNLLPIKKRLI